jgi:hypothetical protein
MAAFSWLSIPATTQLGTPRIPETGPNRRGEGDSEGKPGGDSKEASELFFFKISQYRRSLIRDTMAVTPFRGVGFGAVWEAPP